MGDGLLACLPLELRLVLRSLTTQKYAISLSYSFPLPSSTNNNILIPHLILSISFNYSYSYSYFEVSTNILSLHAIYLFSSNHSFYNFRSDFSSFLENDIFLTGSLGLRIVY